MTRRVLAACLAVVGCGSGSTKPTPSPQSAAPTVSATTMIGPASVGRMTQVSETVDQFTPGTGAQALKDFVADALPSESGGECSLTRSSGNGALTVIAFHPSRSASTMQTMITFDSVGHVVRYNESRNLPPFKRGMRVAQMDSVRRAFEAANRMTTISFDYPADRAFATNRGAGKPTVAIMSAVREMENLENLQRPRERMERMRKLCGV